MDNGSRGQAAFELMLTYGWAILGVVIVLGTVGYFTGFYAKLTPESCAIQPPFVCLEKAAYKNGTVLLGVQDGAGWDATQVNLTLWCNQNPAQAVSATQALLKTQERMNGSIIRLQCPSSLGPSFKAKIFVNYTVSGETTSHVALGDMRVATQ